jgi:hypothetical protein
MNGQVPVNQRAIDRACRVARFLMMGGASREVAELMTMAGNNFAPRQRCSMHNAASSRERTVHRRHLTTSRKLSGALQMLVSHDVAGGRWLARHWPERRILPKRPPGRQSARPRQQVTHRAVMPCPTARRPHAAVIQRRSDGTERGRTRRLNLARDRQQVGGEGVPTGSAAAA